MAGSTEFLLGRYSILYGLILTMLSILKRQSIQTVPLPIDRRSKAIDFLGPFGISDAMKKQANAAKSKKRGPAVNTKWHARFIAEMLKFPNVSAASVVCGVSWSTAHRHREKYPEFAEAWDDTKRKAADLLEQAAIQRATAGTLRPVYQGGKLVGEVREHSDTLAAFLLKGLKPETYGDKGKIDLSATVRMTDEEITAASAETKQSLLLTLAAGLNGGNRGG